MTLAPALLLLAGCGGGGAGTPPAPGGGGTVVAGSMHIEGSVSQPQVAGSGTGNVTSYALQGNIAKAMIVDGNPTAEEAEIVVSRYGPLGNEIIACNPDGTGLRSLATIPDYSAQKLAVSPDGLYVYFVFNGVLQRVPIGGGPRTSILSNVQDFAFTPAGSKLILRRNNVEIWTANTNGTSPVLIGSNPSDGLIPVGGLSETRGLFVGLRSVYVMDLVPGSSPSGSLFYFSNLSIQWCTYHRPSSSLFIYLYDSNTLKRRIDRIGVTQYLSFQVTVLSSDAPISYVGAVAPDGQSLAAGLDEGLQRTLTNLSPYRTILPKGAFHSVAWRPVPPTRYVVGAGSTFTGGAGALLFSERSNQLPAYVLADATTRGSIAVSILNQGAGNIVYDIACDQLTKLYAASANAYIPSAIVNSASSGLKGAVVSFDGSTGALATVVTYNKKPILDKRPGSVRISGDGIVGVFDGAGKELPHGASVLLQ